MCKLTKDSYCHALATTRDVYKDRWIQRGTWEDEDVDLIYVCASQSCRDDAVERGPPQDTNIVKDLLAPTVPHTTARTASSISKSSGRRRAEREQGHVGSAVLGELYT